MSRQAKTADDLENTYVDERVKELLPKFEDLAPYKITERKKGKKLGTETLPGWELLAAQETKLLKLTYPDDRPEELREYGTCLRQITALKKELKLSAKTQLKDAALYHPVCTIITNFGNALSYQFSSYKTQQNTRYREKVDDRRKAENRIQLDLTNSLKYAYNLFTEIKSGGDANWLDISCAIALGTGRRMGEVHCSGEFNCSGEYEITFKGQLKVKSRKVKVGDKAVSFKEIPYTIPTLLPAELICFAVNWLEDKGKRFDRDEDPERVNRRFSKTLNQACKDWDIFPDGEKTYHKFRAAYLRAAIINDGKVDNYDFTDYAKKILGDNDEATINAYKRYEIKQGTVTKI